MDRRRCDACAAAVAAVAGAAVAQPVSCAAGAAAAACADADSGADAVAHLRTAGRCGDRLWARIAFVDAGAGESGARAAGAAADSVRVTGDRLR